MHVILDIAFEAFDGRFEVSVTWRLWWLMMAIVFCRVLY